MSNQPVDESTASPQARRMRTRLRKAMTSLLKESDFEDITVEEVAQRADVHRSTVYRYYGSLDDMLGDCLCEHFGRVNRDLPDVDDPCFFEKAHEALIDSYREIKENPKLYACCTQARYTLSLDPVHLKRLKEQATLFSVSVSKALVIKYGIERFPMEYFEQLLQSVGASLIRTWTKDGFRQSPEDMAKVTAAMYEGLAVSAARCKL